MLTSVLLTPRFSAELLMMMMSENLEPSDDVAVLPPQEAEPHREEDGHCALPFR